LCEPLCMGGKSHIFLFLHLVQGSRSESYSAMKEQVERTKEELKTQQKELEKSKKEVRSSLMQFWRAKFVFFFVFLSGCFFCQCLMFLQKVKFLICRTKIFQLSDELHSYLVLARISSEAAFLQHNLTETNIIKKLWKKYLL